MELWVDTAAGYSVRDLGCVEEKAQLSGEAAAVEEQLGDTAQVDTGRGQLMGSGGEVRRHSAHRSGGPAVEEDELGWGSLAEPDKWRGQKAVGGSGRIGTRGSGGQSSAHSSGSSGGRSFDNTLGHSGEDLAADCNGGNGQTGTDNGGVIEAGPGSEENCNDDQSWSAAGLPLRRRSLAAALAGGETAENAVSIVESAAPLADLAAKMESALAIGLALAATAHLAAALTSTLAVDTPTAATSDLAAALAVGAARSPELAAQRSSGLTVDTAATAATELAVSIVPAGSMSAPAASVQLI